ncbi:Ankyrin repeat protein [Legionella gratiana]|uniref:Ankyrin repeat protein n=1 Tax=Legionella gratiana TaxID=45066 RepID=A0A378JDI9_9GAMM|nr:hypothetical protein [Legionella gratiana]KTD11749.1 Ankyrin repeat protein [Legionella gratiana]STX45426.1 Ankyrin repeat protein [Legionella gratiana]
MKLIDYVRSNNFNEVKNRLSKNYFEDKEINEAFQEACSLGYSNLVELFLNDNRVDPTSPSIQAIEYSFSPSITDSFGLQQACYNGHVDTVDLLLKDRRSDPSSGDYRCIKLIVDKAESKDNYKQILQKLTDYCWNNYLNYQDAVGSKLSAKINKILATESYNSASVAFTGKNYQK